MGTDHRTHCIIAGGGPAGIVLGYLLARAGIDTYVLEKHKDFFRDFRGDTIHPSTMEVLGELGLLDEFLRLPHNKTREMVGHINNKPFTIADFSHLKVREPYIAFIPQWDFLNFLAEKARSYDTFHLLMEAEATDLITKDGQVVGVCATHKKKQIEIHADLVVGADGRHSTIGNAAGMKPQDLGAPIDVFWFRLPQEGDGDESLAYIGDNHMMVLLDRDDYWQCGYLIKKGAGEYIKNQGLPAFRTSVAALAPFLSHAVDTLKNWDQVKLLSIRVDRLSQWYKPGLLMIGDAAHAMSPVGGVGINLAIQDAIAAANILIPAYKNGSPSEVDLARIQARRMDPTVKTQWLQLQLHKRLLKPILEGEGITKIPFALKLLQWIPLLRRFPAQFVGIGFGPEHIDPEVSQYLQD